MEQAKATSSPVIGNVVDYLFEHSLAPGNAERPYLIGGTAPVTFAETYARACQVGHWLRSLGVGVGDRVLFSVADGVDFVALFLGAMKIGAVSLPINIYLKARDYAYYIDDSEACVIVADASLAGMMTEIRSGLPKLRHLAFAGARVPGETFLDDVLAAMPTVLETVPRAEDDTAFWLYSSGSTGDPKGVVHTHGHIYWATELFGLVAQGIHGDDVIFCPPKMFFAFGLGNQVYFPLRAGASVVCNPEPARVETVHRLIVEHEPTLLVSVPTLFAGVLNLVGEDEDGSFRHACRRLRFSVSGGEMLPPSVLRRWQEATGSEILDGVGTTEMTHMFMINRPGAVVPGSCGGIVDGFEAVLLDDEWQPVAEGEIGNLFVRGPTAAREYWNKPEKTAATMRDGGVLTGDKCRRDAAGNYFYIGRNDDMLRVGGIWVSPAEIEAALAEHPAVLECAAIGHADENLMIKPRAYVILRDGAAAAEMEAVLRDFLRDRLAHYKCPRWIDFVSELPKTATGKIQRFRLRAAAAEGA